MGLGKCADRLCPDAKPCAVRGEIYGLEKTTLCHCTVHRVRNAAEFDAFCGFGHSDREHGNHHHCRRSGGIVNKRPQTALIQSCLGD